MAQHLLVHCLKVIALVFLREFMKPAGFTCLQFLYTIFNICKLMREGTLFKSTKKRLAGFLMSIIQFTYLSYKCIKR